MSKTIYDKVFFIGTGRVARECLSILKAHRDDVTCLNVEREDFPIVEPTCRKLGIEYKTFDREGLKNFLSAQQNETLIISAHNSYIFPRSVTDKDNLTIINFHNAYLPEYRGRNAPTWEIYDGAEYGGATWHIVDSGIDTGAILVQQKVPIAEDETALSLLTRSAQAGIDLLRNHADMLIRSVSQGMQGGGDNRQIVSFE